MANKMCTKCAMKAGVCEVCGKQMAAPTSRPAAEKIDLTQSKVYQSGKWKYSYQITFQPGTPRQGTNGTLSYDGRALSSAGGPTNNYYETPWGKLYDTGQPNMPNGPHEWMPFPRPGVPVGKQLPDPAGRAGPPATQPATLPSAVAIESVVPGRMVCCAACKAKQDIPGGIGHCSICGDGCNMANKMCTKCATKAGVCEVCGKQMTSPASRPATQPASAPATRPSEPEVKRIALAAVTQR
jgi:hypothetical protein